MDMVAPKVRWNCTEPAVAQTSLGPEVALESSKPETESRDKSGMNQLRKLGPVRSPKKHQSNYEHAPAFGVWARTSPVRQCRSNLISLLGYPRSVFFLGPARSSPDEKYPPGP